MKHQGYPFLIYFSLQSTEVDQIYDSIYLMMLFYMKGRASLDHSDYKGLSWFTAAAVNGSGPDFWPDLFHYVWDDLLQQF